MRKILSKIELFFLKWGIVLLLFLFMSIIINDIFLMIKIPVKKMYRYSDNKNQIYTRIKQIVIVSSDINKGFLFGDLRIIKVRKLKDPYSENNLFTLKLEPKNMEAK